MEHSEQINELAAALSKAQSEITGALKDTANTFFKSKYADLAACWDACRGPLSKNGLAVIQAPSMGDAGLSVTTMLVHSSGQWMRETLRMIPTKADPQGVGSAITYARRYALAAMVGLAQIDDDAEAAQGRAKGLDPRGEQRLTTAQIDYATEFATAMRKIMHPSSDFTEEQMISSVMDLHAEMNEDQQVYIAAADLLTAPERKAWKGLHQLGMKAAKQA